MINIHEGNGRTAIQLIAEDTGRGLALLLIGGESPHIGGVVLATPRKSLSGHGMSADVYVIPVSGHKDTEILAPIAKHLCALLGEPVSATAGIHIENADSDVIDSISKLCWKAVNELERILSCKDEEQD